MAVQSVCILGGSGFVGSHIVSRLSASGRKTRVLSRRKSSCNHLLVLPNVEIVESDIHEQNNLDTAFADMDAVINLVGILNEKGHSGEGFRRTHVELPRKMLNACHHNKVTRILHMSALNADANSGPSHYLRTKGEGENHVHAFAGKIAVTSFRPSVIFGREDSFFNRFAQLLKLSPVFFPLACAQARFAPVYVEDVAQCFIDALDDKSTCGERYDLCGPKVYTLKQLVEYTARTTGLRRRIIGLPDVIARLQASILEYAPGKPFSVDNYHSLSEDSICKDGRILPTAIESVVPYYLGDKNMRLQLDRQRRAARRWPGAGH